MMVTPRLLIFIKIENQFNNDFNQRYDEVIKLNVSLNENKKRIQLLFKRNK